MAKLADLLGLWKNIRFTNEYSEAITVEHRKEKATIGVGETHVFKVSNTCETATFTVAAESNKELDVHKMTLPKGFGEGAWLKFTSDFGGKVERCGHEQ